MKKLYSILAVAALINLFAGCSKLLELEPSQDLSETVALSTDENVKNVLTGAYTRMALPSIYGGNLLRNCELLGGDGEISWVGTYIDPRQIFNKDMLTTNSEVYVQWRDSYAVINTVNNILSAINIVKEEDQGWVSGEAQFLRGMMYFDLVRFFGDQYQPGVQNTQLGVPIILTPTEGITETSFVSRNTVEEVYAQVISDLTDAASKLPVDNDVYASKGAAKALLARVYLQMGDYAKARDAASDVIASGQYSILTDYADVFNQDNNTAEDIFATQITPQNRFSSMTEFFSIREYGGRDGDIEILSGHLNLYPAGDARRDLFFFGNGAWRTGKWNNQYGCINLIRLAEMYLIRAECNQRLGTAVGATPLADYNKLHTRAGLAPAVSVTLDNILLERRLELAFEGHKIHDQRRLKLAVGSHAWNDPKLLFPVPQREIDANPKLKTQQNPGY
jgi:starch-binding outer membrane protein, SusD/RagB family